MKTEEIKVLEQAIDLISKEITVSGDQVSSIERKDWYDAIGMISKIIAYKKIKNEKAMVLSRRMENEVELHKALQG